MHSKRITIRNFNTKDLDKVIDINRLSLPENYIPAFFLDIHKNCSDAFQVAEVNGDIVGYIMCRIENGFSDFKRFRVVKKGHIVSIAVRSEYRKMGIGSALLNETIKVLRRFAVNECFMEVRVNNFNAIKLYKKIGFEFIRRGHGYYQDGSDAYTMGINFSN
ncbi:MAG: ribosomal protein S18-alanine N-acetyltransferase [Candidatus Bathyarchaeota archaeon]|nr:ribosomal protein S18-alanine N-acetyltransferase [Candidatus Bathyarchaeota archaeon]